MGAIGWIVLVWLLLIVLLVAWRVAYNRWLHRAFVRATADSQTIETRLGVVEYSRYGSGPVVLHFHCANAGHDGWRQLRHLVDAGYTVLTPDRPGYWGTSLSLGATPEAQSEIALALLDALGIDQVATVGICTGGPGAIEFAARHADRCAALVLISATTQATPLAHEASVHRLKRLAEKPANLEMNVYLLNRMMGWMPKRTLRQIVQGAAICDAADLERIVAKVLADPTQMQTLRADLETAAPAQQRFAGYMNDVETQTTMSALPFEQVKTPTLIVASRFDRMIPYESAVAAHEQIVGSELMTVDQAGHLVWLGDSAVTRAIEERIEEFLGEHFLARVRLSQP